MMAHMSETRSDDATAARLLSTAVTNVQRHHPVHWTRMVSSDADLVPHRVLHPVFAGSYDWHSCVHQTWLAVRVLRLRPHVEGAAEAEAVLDSLITPEGCATEAAFFSAPEGLYWERPYGWAWLLLLDAELRTSGSRWAEPLRPLSEAVRANWLTWITGATLPVRTGTHGNTALATALVLDAARAVGDSELAAACEAAALRWYRGDTRYGAYEPDAADFLSPALTEADLLRRVLPQQEFTAWFEAFLPDLDEDRWTTLREPFPADDPSDPYGAHLAGLALSRAWGWAALAGALPAGHRWAATAERAAQRHHEAGWSYVFGHGYAAEHWLGTFAAYLDLGALD